MTSDIVAISYQTYEENQSPILTILEMPDGKKYSKKEMDKLSTMWYGANENASERTEEENAKLFVKWLISRGWKKIKFTDYMFPL